MGEEKAKATDRPTDRPIATAAFPQAPLQPASSRCRHYDLRVPAAAAVFAAVCLILIGKWISQGRFLLPPIKDPKPRRTRSDSVSEGESEPSSPLS